MSKKKIAVVFGGCSPEYGVSLQSAAAVIRHMDPQKYEPVLLGITAAGDWFYYTGDISAIEADTWYSPDTCYPAAVSPSRADRAVLILRDGKPEKLPVDAAFPVLHGKNGEDGTVQGLFALAGIPVVGCGVLASALCMDKDRAHRLVREAGVAVPMSRVLEKHMPYPQAAALAREVGYPLFVKPVKAGSSFGISRVEDCTALAPALERAFAFDDRAVLEEAIPGFEVGCAVMGNDSLLVGEVDEIELTEGFFDYTEKYTLRSSAIHVPARISPEAAFRVKETAKTIYRTLDCRGFARVDMFYTPDGDMVFNEVNTIPGFTAHSRFPNMLKAVGISLDQAVSIAIDLALEA